MNNSNSIGDFVFIPVNTGDPTSSAIATGVATAIATVMNSINKGKPNPNDWKGWNQLDQKMGYPIGTNVTGWIIKDGQSIQNEALNILQYVREFGFGNVLGYNSYWNKTITEQDLVNKLNRGGYVQEAQQLMQALKPANPISNLLSPSGNTPVSTSKLLLYGGIILGVILLLKNKQ
jgi:hypothetical protein